MSPFHPLLFLLITVPQILAILYFDIKLQVAYFLTTSTVALYYNYTGRKSKLKIPFILGGLFIALFQTFGHFSLASLVDNMFLISSFFILYLLFQRKSFRNYLYIALLGFLNLTLVSVAFQSILYGLFLLLYLLGLVYFFLLLAVGGYTEKPKKLYLQLFKYSILVYTFVFLFGVFLFFLLPRPQKPLLNLAQKKTPKAKISFAENVKLGAFSKVSEDNSVVFRAKIFGLKTKTPYWRGNTLEIFKGETWYPSKGKYAEVERYLGKKFVEEILVNPYGDKSIFSVGYPKEIISSSGEVEIDKTKGVVEIDKTKGVLVSKEKIYKPLRVKFTAYESVKVKLLNLKQLLEIPQNIKPVLEKLVKRYKLRRKTFGETLKAVGKFFSLFRYSLKNRAKNTVEFLTLYREGNCEYFASASALIFRYLGYPSRVVVGFYGGEYNPITGYIVVRQRDAHAWTEIYYGGTWHRFDATSYALGGFEKNVNLLKKSKLLLFWDTVNTLWLEYVIDLNASKQVKILNKLYVGLKRLKPNLKGFTILLAVLFAIALFLYRKRILLFLYLLRLKFIYGVNLFGSKSFLEVYNLLWKKHPQIWVREKGLIRRLILI